MDKDDKAAGGLPGGGLIVIALLAVGALVISRPPLESSRPTTTEPYLERREVAQDVEARLWQDPFGAVARARERAPKLAGGESDQQRHSEARFAEELLRQGRLAGEGGVFVVAVMLFGGPYADQVESRRRMRYALLAGLQRGGFIPSDNEHLGYFYPYDGEGPRYGLPETVPFESFEHDDATRQQDDATRRRDQGCQGCRLLVLWLDATAFYERPLRKLEVLAWRTAPPGSADERPNPRWRVLGPPSSDMLRSLVAEVDAPDAIGLTAVKPFNFRFFSSGATAPDAQIFHGTLEKTVSAHLAKHGVPFVRTIGTDDELAEALYAELEKRKVERKAASCESSESDSGPAPGIEESPNRIAVIGEGDTLYGRALRKFGSRTEPDGPRFCVSRYTYFRGIDGRLPGENAIPSSDTRNKKESKPEGTDSIGRDSAYIERPEGTSQFDYLRRLAIRIRAEDETVRREDRNGIRAIGVFGTDVYDKLLVLQALQPEVPHAIFFTTDLDVRLHHPHEQNWARNLLVASSFGLSLSESLQRGTPPFRDSYQTAAYLATLMLVADAAATVRDPAAGPLWKQEAIDTWFAKPRLFEVTRSGVFDFTPVKDPVKCRLSALQDCPDIHPPGNPLAPQLSFAARALVAVSLVAVLTVPAFAINRRVRRRLRRYVAGARGAVSPRWQRALAAWTLPFVAALAVALVLAWAWPNLAEWITESGGGKPLSLTAGISPWPTYLLRFAALLLSILFVVHGWIALQGNVERIARDFRLGSTRRRLERLLEKQPRSRWQRLASMVEIRFYRERLPNGTVSAAMTPQAENFWMHYIVQNRLGARLLRTALCVAFWVMFAAFLFAALGEAPVVPKRGHLSSYGHWFTLVPAVIAAQFLVFFVVDATVLCVLFVRGLRMHSANWPEPTLRAFESRLAVAHDHLDDWIDLQFVARRTRSVAALVYLPFIILSLLLLARSSFFDDFYAPIALQIVTAVSFAIVLACAVGLRRTAEASRRQALAHVRDSILREKGVKDNALRLGQLEALRERIETLRDGAFAPYSQQPLLKAVLLPLFTVGGASLFDYLSMAGL